MTQLTESIGPTADPENFPYTDLRPEFECYAYDVDDAFEGTHNKIMEVPIPTLELGNSHVGVSLSLPCGLAVVHNRVVKCTRYNDGNVIDYTNKNPFLHTR
jgi:hypothetical protein